MIKNVMTNTGGVAVYGLLSVCLFFAFFTGMLIWVCRLKKPYLNSMGELPLERDPAPQHTPENPSNPEHRHE